MEVLKNQANDYFKKGKYPEAMEYYTKAIDAEPLQKETAPCFGNRSFAACKLELYGTALADANKAIELDPFYIKAYYRRAAAMMALNRHKSALEDFKKVAELQKDLKNQDKFIYAKIKECEKLIHRLAFEKAISVEAKKEKPLAYTIDCDSIYVDNNYDGPRLKDDKHVTLTFIKQLIENYKLSRQPLHRRYVLEILSQVYKHFVEQPSLVDINIPNNAKFTVVGDVHGQFFDLLNIFELNGNPSEENPYLFNGDIVDRGSFSIECILLLLSYKLLYPKHFYISRGNHETHTMNQMYGFEGECKHKYSPQIYEFFTQVFQVLPLAYCLIGRDEQNKEVTKVLVMHGGLFSQDNVKLDDIRKIDRNKQPPNEGLMCEILWSDPMPMEGRTVSKRGIAIAFGPDVTREFCKNNNLEYIIRSHEAKQTGYEVAHGGKCVTVFSAPNYCDTMGNEGAIIKLQGPHLKPEFVCFSAVEHPEMKPMAYANHLLNML